MNCDQVFDILTRGPFPSGAASDAAVQRHLGHCAECRQLAEALRPALDLIHESVSPEESWGLPGYWDEMPSSGQPVTVRQRERLAVRRATAPLERAKRHRAERAVWLRRYVLATLAGVCGAIALFSLVQAVGRRVDERAIEQVTLMPISWPPQTTCVLAAGSSTLGAANPEQLSRDLSSCATCHPPRSHHWAVEKANTTVSATCLECHRFLVRH